MLRAIAVSFFAVALALPSFASAQGICPSLSRGMSGDRVLALQQVLARAYTNFPTPTGFFGAVTESAVKQWQSDKGIVSSGTPATTGWGVAGPRTLRAMGLCSGATPTPTPPNPTTPPLGSCQLNTRTMPHGTSVTMYESFSALAGQACRPQTRTCYNGVLSGNYIYPSCGAATNTDTNTHTNTNTNTNTSTTTPGLPTGSISVSSTAVALGGALNITWNFTNAPAGSKVRLEVYKSTDTPTEGNNDRGLASNVTELGANGTYAWKVPSGDACLADAGHITCINSGTYKVVAKLYSGNTCWGYCSGNTPRTVHATAQSTAFTIGNQVTNACVQPARDLRLGEDDESTSGQVSVLQILLARDTAIYPEALVTGFFGQATERAVVRFQNKYNVSPTGFVGPLTRTAMQAFCENKPSPQPGKYSFKATPTLGAAPLTVAFTARGFEGYVGFTYVVDFGDGERGEMSVGTTTLTASHTYAKAGTYTVRMLQVEYLCGGVSNGYGCDKELQVEGASVTVTAPPTPPGYSVHTTCSVSSGFTQSLVIRFADGSEHRFDVGAGEIPSKVYDIQRTSVPVLLTALHNGSEPNFSRTTTGTNSIRIESEDWTDNDYNDLICTVTWGTGSTTPPPGGGGGGGGGTVGACMYQGTSRPEGTVIVTQSPAAGDAICDNGYWMWAGAGTATRRSACATNEPIFSQFGCTAFEQNAYGLSNISPRHGKAPFTLSFTSQPPKFDTCGYTIIWGDGASTVHPGGDCNTKNELHTYTAPGTYTLSYTYGGGAYTGPRIRVD